MSIGALPSAFVISLDLEQAWGSEARHIGPAELAAYHGARKAIPLILDLAARYGVAITWATVGLLFFDDRDEMLEHLPLIRPGYADPRLSAYSRIGTVGRNERDDPLHFGRSLIRRIQQCPRQEIAGHTFSHYYTLEDRSDPAAFADDLAAARRAAALLGVTLRSIVFPRNQVNEAYLPICRSAGYRSYRGAQRGIAHRSRPRLSERMDHRALRLASSYLPAWGVEQVDRPAPEQGMVDVPASHFLRPSQVLMPVFNHLQVGRIRHRMRRAARMGALYHLWWHPQNFGRNIERNLRVLECILEHYRRLADEFGMASVSMAEVAEACLAIPESGRAEAA